VGTGLESEQVAHTFKYLGVNWQGSFPNSLFVTRKVQEFCPTHFEINIALVVFKAQLEVANDPQSFPNGVPYEAKGNSEIIKKGEQVIIIVEYSSTIRKIFFLPVVGRKVAK
jgi:hypothetical protein